MPPQDGNNNQVNFPEKICNSEYLKNLEPLGWIHTQGQGKSIILNKTIETLNMSPQDLIKHARMTLENKNLDAEKSVVITVAFPPGTCSVTAYKATPAGKK